MSTAVAAILPIETVLIYARVSHDPKNKGESVARQVELGKQWATMNGHAVGRVFDQDTNRSASKFATKARPDWERVKAAIAEPNRRETILWTWEDTRATRDRQEYLNLATLCVNHNLRWAYGGKVYDLANSDDEFFTGLSNLLAVREVKKTSERVSGAMASHANQGVAHGRIPYGYIRIVNPDETRHRIIDESEASILREAANRFLSGESLHSIAKDFNSREIPTPGEAQFRKAKPNEQPPRNVNGWDGTGLRQLLKNPVSNGKRTHKGKIVADGSNWQPIIDDITFARLQAKFADPTRRMIRQREGARILTGVTRCGKCGGPFGFAFKPYKGGRRPVYYCKYHYCTTRNQADLEAHVAEFVIDLMGRNDLTNDDPSPEMNTVRDQINELRTEKAELVTMLGQRVIKARDFGLATNELDARIKNLEQSIRVTNIPTVAIDMAASNDPAEYWDSLEDKPELRREIIRSMVTVTVFPTANRGSHRYERETVVIEPIR